ncbi:hypothetical protein JCM19233_5639 [Vibrio astriarenae]|nr:hypothetical protein JCM19233_5639 [Vibrio sp. C7]
MFGGKIRDAVLTKDSEKTPKSTLKTSQQTRHEHKTLSGVGKICLQIKMNT